MDIDWEGVKEEATGLLSGYLKVDTTNPPGKELAGAKFLQAVLEREGIGTTLLESDPGRGNLLCRMRGTGEALPLILLHHIDVVPAEEEKWRHPPYSGAAVNGEIWGRGAQDCKSLGIVELLSFLLLKREGFKPKRDIVYMATADEEAGGEMGGGLALRTSSGLDEGRVRDQRRRRSGAGHGEQKCLYLPDRGERALLAETDLSGKAGTRVDPP